MRVKIKGIFFNITHPYFFIQNMDYRSCLAEHHSTYSDSGYLSQKQIYLSGYKNLCSSYGF